MIERLSNEHAVRDLCEFLGVSRGGYCLWKKGQESARDQANLQVLAEIKEVFQAKRGRYGSPRFFLSLLRRHVYTGAFCHPKYGGNSGAAGWAYLAEHYLGKDGATLFAWRGNCDMPFGLSEDYNG